MLLILFFWASLCLYLSDCPEWTVAVDWRSRLVYLRLFVDKAELVCCWKLKIFRCYFFGWLLLTDSCSWVDCLHHPLQSHSVGQNNLAFSSQFLQMNSRVVYSIHVYGYTEVVSDALRQPNTWLHCNIIFCRRYNRCRGNEKLKYIAAKPRRSLKSFKHTIFWLKQNVSVSRLTTCPDNFSFQAASGVKVLHTSFFAMGSPAGWKNTELQSSDAR